MEINVPSVVAEVRAAFADYEAALMANDVERLDGWFWNDPLVVRFGVGENLYGAVAIAAYRRSCLPPPPRRLARTVVTTFGNDMGTAVTEYQEQGAAEPGRQSQTWIRLPVGWRIVSAHVSLPKTAA